MKNFRFAPLVLAMGTLLCFAAACVAPPKESRSHGTGTLSIVVVGLASAEGQVHIAVFASEDSWLGAAAYQKVLEAGGPTCEWTIENVPYGDYGVAVFHDANRNGLKDTNLFGVPTEAYGFSNNARRPLGPAEWEQARIVVSGPLHEIEIEVR
jgi:uncharacterized protein (DUF2141 family)